MSPQFTAASLFAATGEISGAGPTRVALPASSFRPTLVRVARLVVGSGSICSLGGSSPPEPGCQDLSASGHDSLRSIPDAPRSQLAEADHSGDAGFVPVPEQKGCIGSGR